MADLSQLSDAELEGIIAAEEAAKPKMVSSTDMAPEWAGQYPNGYAALMTGLDMAGAGASLLKGTGAGMAAGAGINAGAQALKRYINGEPTTLKKVLTDATIGAGTEGLGRIIGKGVQALSTSVPNKLYQSAMKFSNSPTVLPPAERAKIIQTGLDNGFMPNEASYLRLKNTVGANSSKVDDILNAATSKGDTIAAQDVINKGSLADLLNRGQQVRGVSPAYGQEVDNVINAFKAGETIAPYTPNDINAAKRQLYQELEDAYKQGTLSDPKVQSKKQLAAGLKTILEERYPEISALNANSSELLALSDHLARSIGRTQNRDIIGLGDKVVMDTVANIPSDGGMAGKTLYGAVMATLDRPAVKARLAQALYKSNTGKALPMTQWRKGLEYVDRPAKQVAKGAFDAAVLGASNSAPTQYVFQNGQLVEAQ